MKKIDITDTGDIRNELRNLFRNRMAFYDGDPRKGGKRITLYEHLESMGANFLPTGNCEKMKVSREESYRSEVQGVIERRRWNSGIETSESDLKDFRQLWLNDELELVKKWQKDNPKDRTENLIELRKYEVYINNELLKLNTSQDSLLPTSSGNVSTSFNEITSDDSKQDEKLLKSSLIYDQETRNDLYDKLEGYFNEEQRNNLKGKLMGLEDGCDKVLFKENGNKLADVFLQLYNYQLITGHQKIDIERWIERNFQYLYRGQICDFKDRYLNDIISSNRECKSPIITITKLNGKFKIESTRRTPRENKIF